MQKPPELLPPSFRQALPKLFKVHLKCHVLRPSNLSRALGARSAAHSPVASWSPLASLGALVFLPGLRGWLAGGILGSGVLLPQTCTWAAFSLLPRRDSEEREDFKPHSVGDKTEVHRSPLTHSPRSHISVTAALGPGKSPAPAPRSSGGHLTLLCSRREGLGVGHQVRPRASSFTAPLQSQREPRLLCLPSGLGLCGESI